MTTFRILKKTCSVCHNETEVRDITGSNTSGSMDLDTRPPEMLRSTIDAWIERCPSCGYCSSDLSQKSAGTDEIIESSKYFNQLNNDNYPELGNSFLCEAIINRKTGKLAQAAWDYIYAAWTCDDAKKPDQATGCRKRAVEALLLAESHGEMVAADEENTAAILFDLLRRSGQFDRAFEEIKSRRPKVKDSTILQLIDFQYELIEDRDRDCYTIDEATNRIRDHFSQFKAEEPLKRREEPMKSITLEVPASGVTLKISLSVRGEYPAQVVLVYPGDVEISQTIINRPVLQTDENNRSILLSNLLVPSPVVPTATNEGFPPREQTEKMIVQILREHGGKVEIRNGDWNIYDEIAARLGVSIEARNRRTTGTGEPAWRPEVGYARKNLEQRGIIKPTEESGRGTWALA